MSDLIDRQAAIDLWEKYHPTIAVDAMQYDAELRQLPSAEPKRGKWVDDGDPLMLTCGDCGYAVMRYNNTPFCPNCGADMREETT